MCRQIILTVLCFSFRVSLVYTVADSISLDSQRMGDNNIHELIADNYIARMIRRWALNGVLTEGDDRDLDFFADLKGLYETLKYHPGLMERRLRVGGKYPPPLPKNVGPGSIPVKKRQSVFDLGLAQPVCPFKTEWRLIHVAKDMNNSDVEVFQPSNNHSNQYQWFYTVSCDTVALTNNRPACPFCCRGIHSRRFASMCITRKSYVIALVRRQGEGQFDWNYIQVDSSCNCAISPNIGH